MTENTQTDSQQFLENKAKQFAVGFLGRSSVQRKGYLQEIADRGLEDFFFFSKVILGYDDLSVESSLHQDFCDQIMSSSRNWYLEPRGHFKSTLGAVAYPLWRMVKDSSVKIGMFTVQPTVARRNLEEIKAHIETNELLRICYPKLRPAVSGGSRFKCWSQNSIEIERSALTGAPTILAYGLGSRQTGMHFDLIIVDDPVNEDTVTTKDQIEKTVNTFRSILNQVSPNTEIAVLGTVYHKKDLHCRALDGAFPEFNIVKKAAIGENDELLFPERFTLEDAEEGKISLKLLKEALGDYIFQCQYMNNPSSPENCPFDPAYIQTFPRDRLKPEWYSNSYATTDFAFTDNTKSDKNVILNGCFDGSGNLYIYDVFWDRCPASDVLVLLAEKFKRYRPQFVTIEDSTKMRTVDPATNQLLKSGFPVIPWRVLSRSGRSKFSRIIGLQPHFQQGRVFFVDPLENFVGDSELSKPELYLPPRMAKIIDHIVYWSVDAREQDDDLLDGLADFWTEGMAIASLVEEIEDFFEDSFGYKPVDKLSGY